MIKNVVQKKANVYNRILTILYHNNDNDKEVLFNISSQLQKINKLIFDALSTHSFEISDVKH